MSFQYSTRYIFHPVGQGLFASGHIQLLGSTRQFTWVYDCGDTKGGSHAESQIKKSFKGSLPGGKKRIDLLAISHLDSDHWTGIPYLITHFAFKRLLLPYIHEEERYILAAQWLLNWEASAASSREDISTIIGMYLDPVETLGQLGGSEKFEEIIFVRHSEHGAEDGVYPDIGRVADYRGGDTPDDDFTLTMPSSTSERTISDTGIKVYECDSGGIFKLAFHTNCFFELIPYTDPLAGLDSLKSSRDWPSKLVAMKKIINQLAANLRSRSKDTKKILEQARDDLKAVPLSAQRINGASLFLYGGPVKRDEKALVKVYYDHYDHKCLSRCFYPCPTWEFLGPMHTECTSVLYTGDGYLNTDAKCQILTNVMHSQRLERLICLQVMHHGSRYNWHSGLFTKLSAPFGIFSARPTEGPNYHPDEIVWHDYDAHSTAVLVDDNSFGVSMSLTS